METLLVGVGYGDGRYSALQSSARLALHPPASLFAGNDYWSVHVYDDKKGACYFNRTACADFVTVIAVASKAAKAAGAGLFLGQNPCAPYASICLSPSRTPPLAQYRGLRCAHANKMNLDSPLVSAMNLDSPLLSIASFVYRRVRRTLTKIYRPHHRRPGLPGCGT